MALESSSLALKPGFFLAGLPLPFSLLTLFPDLSHTLFFHLFIFPSPALCLLIFFSLFFSLNPFSLLLV